MTSAAPVVSLVGRSRPALRRLAERAAGTALSHLDQLEAEAIHIMREAVAESEKPVLLYSIGKDSSVRFSTHGDVLQPHLPDIDREPVVF